MFKLKILLITGLIMMPIYAHAGANSIPAPINVSSCSFSEWVNTRPYGNTNDEAAEKIILREQWKNQFGGIDIFYPYFKAKEIETKVKEKTSVNIFKIKGKSEFKTNEAKYIFVIKF